MKNGKLLYWSLIIGLEMIAILEYCLVMINQERFVSFFQSPLSIYIVMCLEVVIPPIVFYMIGKKKVFFKEELTLYTNEYLDGLSESERCDALRKQERYLAVIKWLKQYYLILLIIMIAFFTRALIGRIIYSL